MTTKAEPQKIKAVPTKDIPIEELGDQSWGPFKEYQMLSLPWGTYAVEPGEIMRFELRETWDYKDEKMVMRPVPVYETVYIDDERLKPGNSKRVLEAKRERETRGS